MGNRVQFDFLRKESCSHRHARAHTHTHTHAHVHTRTHTHTQSALASRELASQACTSGLI